MRTLRAFALAACCAASLVTAADDEHYYGLALGGGGLSAPKQTATTNVASFRGGGFALFYGHDFGRTRLEGEWQLQSFSPDGYSGANTLDVSTLLASGWVDFEPAERWVISLGLGLGATHVNADFNTCFDYSGCGVLSPVVHDSGGAGVVQTMFGVSWRCAPDLRLAFSLRGLGSGHLGLVNQNGVPFYDDRLGVGFATISLEITY